MFEEGIALKAKYGQENVFDFSLGNPDLEPPRQVIDAIKKTAQESLPHSHGYMPNAGYDFAREAMAKKTTKEQDLKVDKSCLVMQAGAAAAMNCVLKALLNAGEEVIVPAPFFGEYRHYVNNNQGVLVEVPTKQDFSLDIQAIKHSLNEKTAALIINTPNNPTGRVYTKQEICDLCDTLKAYTQKTRHPIYLICDEPYRDIVYDGLCVSSVFDKYDNSIIATSFAKNLSLPGERIGYIAVNPKAQDKDDIVGACTLATRILGFVNANAFFQRVVTLCWDAPLDFSSYEKRKLMITKVLDDCDIEYAKPQGAFYLFCKVPQKFNCDDGAFCEHLKSFNILAAPGSGFGKSGYFRLSYCVSEETIKNSKKAFCAAMGK